MKKHFLKYLISITLTFLLIPISVKASFGDLRYEITSVSIGDSTITFTGWAFIHRTNNYVDVENFNGNVTNGGQKILMRAINANTGEVLSTKVTAGSNSPNYNFYCELFYIDGEHVCSEEYYKAGLSGNSCTNDNNGNGNGTSCYYEDIAFSITFNVMEWNVSENDKISFEIAASNNDFENKLSNNSNYYSYDNDKYTVPVSVYISESLFSSSNFETDFIVVDTNTFVNSVAVIAKDSMLRYYDSDNMLVYFKDNYSYGGTLYNKHVFATYPGANNGCASNVFTLVDNVNGYDGGISEDTEQGMCKDFLRDLGGNCVGSHNYAINVAGISPGKYVCPYPNVNNANEASFVAIIRGSHVRLFGNTVFQISFNDRKLCEVTIPDENSGVLQCNEGKTYNSTCEELTVSTTEGSANVKIEQTGNVSSVLTPESIYAGGGFNLGIMYYNTIKWSYVSGQAIDSDLHEAVTRAMNNKIKDYNAYIAGINISNLKLGDKSFNLVKQCTTSNNNKDYYNKELTVACVFTFPRSEIDQVGNVNYIYDASGINVNNKYYTPINYEGNYRITADIVGMNRITESSSISDSIDSGKGWTGDWSDTFTNCGIDVYGLLYNFIYRPIDIFDPFPNRTAGINWFDWYSVARNVERLESTYSNVNYIVTLDNNAIVDIKNYNSSHNYLEWDSIDEVTNESSFITEKNYIVRSGE